MLRLVVIVVIDAWVVRHVHCESDFVYDRDYISNDSHLL